MASRPLILTSLLGASIGVPYVVSQTTGDGKSTGSSPLGERPAAMSSTTRQQEFQPIQRPQLTGPGSLLYDSPTPLEGERFHSLGEVLRFDLTREWIYQNWARKSTGLGEPDLFGVRVALVTGTGLDDLAGSLTYYFNERGELQHIVFRGRTADTTKLVQFLTSTYRFERVSAPAGEQLYQVRHGGRVQSELRTYPEPVLWSTSPHGSFAVDLRLERPGSNRALPPRTPQLEIPQVASSAPPTPESKSNDGAGDEEPGLMGQMRYASPEEEAQIQRMRWPN